MKSLVQSSFLRDLLICGALMVAALGLSVHFADYSFATSMIDGTDNIGAVEEATGGESDLKGILKTLLNYALTFLGFVMVVMVIYAGVLYITAAGNEDNVGKAKKILLYCVIGVVLIFISYAFVNTILGAASDTSTTGTTTGGVAQ